MKKPIEFKLLTDYHAQHEERMKQETAYQEATSKAKARLSELNTQYAHTFTTSIKTGKDATATLAEIDSQIAEAKAAVEKAARNEQLLQTVPRDNKIDSLEVVEKYRKEFVPAVQAQFVPSAEQRLKLARDLLISVVIDGREYRDEYYEVSDAVKDIAKRNHKEGKTAAYMVQTHPTEDVRIRGRAGAVNAVRGVLEEVSQFTFGITPNDFERINDVSEILKTTEKAEK